MARILIIDDEPVITKLISEVLTRNGEYVQTASNGKHGLKLIANSSYDIIVTDMCLPDLDGASIVRHIRKSNHSSTPVIGISGTPWLLEDAGCDAVFPKPFVLRDLVQTVNNLK